MFYIVNPGHKDDQAPVCFRARSCLQTTSGHDVSSMVTVVSLQLGSFEVCNKYIDLWQLKKSELFQRLEIYATLELWCESTTSGAS
jgi:hypothetical protein